MATTERTGRVRRAHGARAVGRRDGQRCGGGATFPVAVDELVVAPRTVSGRIEAHRPAAHLGGELAGTPGAIAGEIDGVRPWREGDGDKAVHWASTLRSGELVVHDHRHDAERRMMVRARTGTGDPDAEAGRARWALEQGLRAGADVDGRDRRRRTDGDPRHRGRPRGGRRWPTSARRPRSEPTRAAPTTGRARDHRPHRRPVGGRRRRRSSPSSPCTARSGTGRSVTVVVGGVVVIAAAVSVALAGDRARRCRPPCASSLGSVRWPASWSSPPASDRSPACCRCCAARCRRCS